MYHGSRAAPLRRGDLALFDHTHYVPILITKRGERRALADTAAGVKARLTPLFAIAPVAWDYEQEQPAKTVDQHVRGHALEIAQCWGTNTAFIDLVHLAPEARMADGSHPLTHLVAEAATAGLSLEPVVALSSDAAYRAAANNAAASSGTGVCLRLPPEQWPGNVAAADITALLQELGGTPADADLVLDLGDSVGANPALLAPAVRSALDATQQLGNWRSITVAGGSFPGSLADIPRGETMIERREWTLYTALVNAGNAPTRLPTFGDYAIAHPDPVVDVDPRTMSISAAIRYTSDADWLVAKGQLYKGPAGTGQGGAAMVPVAAAVVASTHFRGSGYTAGDTWIADTANGVGGGGNPEAWRRAGTSHHLRTVTDQIASLYAP